MKVSDTKQINFETEVYSLNSGDLYVFNNLAVFEAVEDFTSNPKDESEIINIIEYHFGKTKSFGFLANRINSYSINVARVSKVIPIFPNLKAYSAVYYDDISRRNLEFESHFHDISLNLFNDLKKAFSWTQSTVGY